MGIFLTGSTGYLGAHIASELLEKHHQRLILLVRAPSREAAAHRLWRAFQLHLDFDRFHHHLKTNIQVLTGDLTEEGFGFSPSQYRHVVKDTDSILHVAASLNRKSERACLNINLRGTLEAIKLAQAASADHGLRRFSHISTVAVAGIRQDEVIQEEHAIDWSRSDYDPYARTKKFCEHLIRELLPEIPLTIFRPSIVLGDSRRAETTQFDMVQAFAFLAGLPLLPLRAGDRLDIVNVDFVAEAVATLHQKESPGFDTYHLSSGRTSPTCQDITNALSAVRNRRRPTYVPSLIRPVNAAVGWLARRRSTPVGHLARLMQVFLPYLHWNTVFDNSRAVRETGMTPAGFTDYCYPLYQFATRNHFTYPYRDWPVAEAAYDGSGLRALGQ
jgi:thioester reductase-like protein